MMASVPPEIYLHGKRRGCQPSCVSLAFCLQMIADIEGETREGRARAEGARRERQAAEARKRDRLKAEFLRRQLEAARKKQPQKGGKAGGGAESQSLTPKK